MSAAERGFDPNNPNLAINLPREQVFTPEQIKAMEMAKAKLAAEAAARKVGETTIDLRGEEAKATLAEIARIGAAQEQEVVPNDPKYNVETILPEEVTKMRAKAAKITIEMTKQIAQVRAKVQEVGGKGPVVEQSNKPAVDPGEQAEVETVKIDQPGFFGRLKKLFGREED